MRSVLLRQFPHRGRSRSRFKPPLFLLRCRYVREEAGVLLGEDTPAMAAQLMLLAAGAAGKASVANRKRKVASVSGVITQVG